MEILTAPYTQRVRRREFLLLAAGGLAALCNAHAQEVDSSVSEYKVKAALLYKFLRFVKWPESAGLPESAPFRIAVLGKDPFGSILDKTVSGKSVGDHPITVLRSQKLEEIVDCAVLFVCASEKERLESILAGARKANILTVADTDGFAQQGVMINLVLRDKKVRFQINYGAAREAEIELDAQLLKLAELVGPKNEESSNTRG